jgi:hypothetical protein
MPNSRQGGQEPRPQFKLAMRGYALAVWTTSLPVYPTTWISRSPSSPASCGGYDPAHVDLYIDQVKALKHRPPP